jgi:hypothetical protein
LIGLRVDFGREIGFEAPIHHGLVGCSYEIKSVVHHIERSIVFAALASGQRGPGSR